MYGGSCASTEWYDHVHNVWILGRPLIAKQKAQLPGQPCLCLNHSYLSLRLHCAHRPTKYRAKVFNPEMLRNQFVLRADIVVNRNLGKRLCCWMVGRRRRLAVAKQTGNNDEIFGGLQCLVFANEPNIV